MIDYRCDHCGQRVPYVRNLDRPERILVTLTTAGGGAEHFCSIRCATIWAEWAGYHQTPTDGIIDAEIYCGATSESGSSCKFPDEHAGDHVSYKGEVWSRA